jgi:hypothetical protein
MFASFQNVLFVFDNGTDNDLAVYEYELYEEDDIVNPNTAPYALQSGATALSTGAGNSSVFAVPVEGSYIDVENDNVVVQKNFFGRVRAKDTSGNTGVWTAIVKTDPSTPLIDSQYIVSLTADKIKAGTIESAEIILGGANPAETIIKSITFDGTPILDGGGNPTGSYSGATQGWLINGQGKSYFYDATIVGSIDIGGFDSGSFHVNTDGDMWLGSGTFSSAPFKVEKDGSIYSIDGKIGPVNITSSTMNSQGSSPWLNPNNNYYRFDQFGDITVFSNPGSDVAPGGVHLNQFHRTNIVGEYINIQRHSDSSFNSSPTILAAFMGNAQGSTMEFSLTEGSVNKFLVKTDGTLTTSTSISSPSITGTTSISSPFINSTGTAQVASNLNIGNNSSAGPVYVNSNSIEIQTDTNFGGIYDAHTGYAIYSTMSIGWGNAELFFQCSNNWQSYAFSPVAFKIGQSTVTASGYAYFSDRRLKENIVDCNFGLKEILQLNPKNYNLIQDGLIKPINENDPAVQVKTRTGLIAQEVLDVIPSIVSGGENEEYYSLDYNMLIPVLVNAIKELTTKVEELESRLI